MKHSKSSVKEPDNPASSLKDRIVALSIDLDDKNKLCEALQRKIDKERKEIAQVEARVADEFSPKLENLIYAQKKELDDIIESISSYMTEKKDLLSRCQLLVEELQREEHLLDQDIRTIHRQGDASIEQDRLSYKSSYEERLSLKIAQRLQEYKDQTARALEPEIQRLKANHDREMHEIEYSHQQHKQRLIDEIETTLSSRITSSEAELKASSDDKLHHIQASYMHHRQVLQDDHNKMIQRLRDEVEQQHQEERQRLQTRYACARRDTHDELQRMQLQSRQRIDDTRIQHSKELAAIDKTFEQQKRDMMRSLDEDKHKINMLLDAEDRAFDDSDDDHHMQLSSSSPSSAIDASYQLDRDNRIQQEIMSLQTETVRLERQWQQHRLTQQRQIDATIMHEEQQLLIQQQRYTSSTSDMILISQQHDHDAHVITQQLSPYDRMIHDMMIQQQMLDEEMMMHRQRLNQFLSLRRQDDEEEAHVYESDRRALKKDFDDASQQLSSHQQQHDEKMHHMEAGYDEELERLDDHVKQQIMIMDQDIMTSKDSIAAENIAIDRLQRLIQHYQQQ